VGGIQRPRRMAVTANETYAGGGAVMWQDNIVTTEERGLPCCSKRQQGLGAAVGGNSLHSDLNLRKKKKGGKENWPQFSSAPERLHRRPKKSWTACSTREGKKGGNPDLSPHNTNTGGKREGRWKSRSATYCRSAAKS